MRKPWLLLLSLSALQLALGAPRPAPRASVPAPTEVTLDYKCFASFWPALTSKCQARSGDNDTPDLSDDLADTLRAFIASCVDFGNQDQRVAFLLTPQLGFVSPFLAIVQSVAALPSVQAARQAVSLIPVSFTDWGALLVQFAQNKTALLPNINQLASGFVVDNVALPSLSINAMLTDLSSLIQFDSTLSWAGVHPFYRSAVISENGLILALPMGGIVYQLHYREDVLHANNLTLPNTWDDLLAAAAVVHGQDMDGDGQPDAALCLMRMPNCFSGFNLLAIWSSYVQSMGTSQGAFFDPATMEPMLHSAAMSRAMEVYLELKKYGHRDEDQLCYPVNVPFLLGQCAFTIGWSGQYKVNSLYPSSRVSTTARVSLLPGTTHVLNRTTNTLEQCTPKSCPFASQEHVYESGTVSPGSHVLVNRAPFLGLYCISLGISARAPFGLQQLLFQVYSRAAGPVASWQLVTDYMSELGPFRSEHFDHANIKRWVSRGYNATLTTLYLDTSKAAIEHPNLLLEARVPANPQTLRSIITSAASLLEFNTTTADQIPTIIDAMATAVKDNYGQDMPGFNKIASMYRYQISWAMPSPPPPAAPDAPDSPDRPPAAPTLLPQGSIGAATTASVVIGTVVGCGLCLLVTLVLAYRAAAGDQGRRLAWQAKPPTGPVSRFLQRLLLPYMAAGPTAAPGKGSDTTLIVTDVESSTELWEALDPHVMDMVWTLHHGLMRLQTSKHGGYESQTEGDSFIIGFPCATTALTFCMEAQKALTELDWPQPLIDHPICAPVWAKATRHIKSHKHSSRVSLGSRVSGVFRGHRASKTLSYDHQAHMPPSAFSRYRETLSNVFHTAMQPSTPGGLSRVDVLGSPEAEYDTSGTDGETLEGLHGLLYDGPRQDLTTRKTAQLSSTDNPLAHAALLEHNTLAYPHPPTPQATQHTPHSPERGSHSSTLPASFSNMPTAQHVPMSDLVRTTANTIMSDRTSSQRHSVTFPGPPTPLGCLRAINTSHSLASDVMLSLNELAISAAVGAGGPRRSSATGAPRDLVFSTSHPRAVVSTGQLPLSALGQPEEWDLLVGPAQGVGPHMPQHTPRVSSVKRHSSKPSDTGDLCKTVSSKQVVGLTNHSASQADGRPSSGWILTEQSTDNLSKELSTKPSVLSHTQGHSSWSDAPNFGQLGTAGSITTAPDVLPSPKSSATLPGLISFVRRSVGKDLRQQDAGISSGEDASNTCSADEGHTPTRRHSPPPVRDSALYSPDRQSGPTNLPWFLATQPGKPASWTGVFAQKELAYGGEDGLSVRSSQQLPGSEWACPTSNTPNSPATPAKRNSLMSAGSRLTGQEVLSKGPLHCQTFQNELQEMWQPCAAGTPGAVLVWRGLRVRMGGATGMHADTDLIYNEAAGRLKYSGVFLDLAKCISHVAHGGQIVVSEATRLQLPSHFLQERKGILVYLGEYELENSGRQQVSLFSVGKKWMLSRMIEVKAPRAVQLSLGTLEAPIGNVVLASIKIASRRELLTTGGRVAEEVLNTFDALLLTQTYLHGGYVLPGVDPSPGHIKAVFSSGRSAISWALDMQHHLMWHPWSPQVLEHPQCEVIRAGDTSPSGDTPIAFRGPRIKAAVVRGPITGSVNYSTGRIHYRGPLMNQLKQYQEAAMTGMVVANLQAGFQAVEQGDVLVCDGPTQQPCLRQTDHFPYMGSEPSAVQSLSTPSGLSHTAGQAEHEDHFEVQPQQYWSQHRSSAPQRASRNSDKILGGRTGKHSKEAPAHSASLTRFVGLSGMASEGLVRVPSESSVTSSGYPNSRFAPRSSAQAHRPSSQARAHLEHMSSMPPTHRLALYSDASEAHVAPGPFQSLAAAAQQQQQQQQRTHSFQVLAGRTSRGGGGPRLRSVVSSEQVQLRPPPLPLSHMRQASQSHGAIPDRGGRSQGGGGVSSGTLLGRGHLSDDPAALMPHSELTVTEEGSSPAASPPRGQRIIDPRLSATLHITDEPLMLEDASYSMDEVHHVVPMWRPSLPEVANSGAPGARQLSACTVNVKPVSLPGLPGPTPLHTLHMHTPAYIHVGPHPAGSRSPSSPDKLSKSHATEFGVSPLPSMPLPDSLEIAEASGSAGGGHRDLGRAPRIMLVPLDLKSPGSGATGTLHAFLATHQHSRSRHTVHWVLDEGEGQAVPEVQQTHSSSTPPQRWRMPSLFGTPLTLPAKLYPDGIRSLTGSAADSGVSSRTIPGPLDKQDEEVQGGASDRDLVVRGFNSQRFRRQGMPRNAHRPRRVTLIPISVRFTTATPSSMLSHAGSHPSAFLAQRVSSGARIYSKVSLSEASTSHTMGHSPSGVVANNPSVHNARDSAGQQQARSSAHSMIDAMSWRTSSPRSTFKSSLQPDCHSAGSFGPGWLRPSPPCPPQRHTVGDGEAGTRLAVLMESMAPEQQCGMVRRKSSSGVAGRVALPSDKASALRAQRGRASVDDLTLNTRRTSPGPWCQETEGSAPSRSRLHISAGRSSGHA